MTCVRISSVERRVPPGPTPDSVPTDVVLLADDAGQRELPIWLLAHDGDRIARVAGPAAAAREHAAATARSADELTGRLVRAAGASVAGVDIDQLGPGVTVARIELAGPAGTRHVPARLGEGLAIAATAGAPIRVSDAMLDRLAVAAGTSGAGPLPAPTAAVLRPGVRPRYEPRNMEFGDGLTGWQLGGSFAEHASESHWHDYSCAAGHAVATLASAVPRPDGFAFLAQEMFADDYLETTVAFRGQVRKQDSAGAGTASRAGLFLRVSRGRDIGSGRDIRGPMTEAAILADPGLRIVTIAGSGDWDSREVTAFIPDDCTTVMFGVFLAGPGRIELRDPDLSRGMEVAPVSE